MKENLFDIAVRELGKDKNISFVNIGAMDGCYGDTLSGYINTFDFRGLYVEPIPHLFKKLIYNTGGLHKYENAAVFDFDGFVEMTTISTEPIDRGEIHDCFAGMSAINPPRNGLGSESDRPVVEKYGRVVKVPCFLLETILTRHEVYTYDILQVDVEGHDYTVFKQIDFKNHKPQVIRLEYTSLDDKEIDQIVQALEREKFIYTFEHQDIVAISPQLWARIDLSVQDRIEIDKRIDQPINILEEVSLGKVTLVTGFWDIGRGELSKDWARSRNQYYNRLSSLLETDCNFIIFGDEHLKRFVEERRSTSNTQFILREIEWFKEPFYDRIQKIRTDPKWYNQASWLPDSTQAQLDMYNPVVMSKMFLLNDARILEKFNSEYLFWIDAGITNTVHPGYFTHDKVLKKIPSIVSKFSFICFPYEANKEVHGFEYEKLNEYAGATVKRVARGGFFGGPKDTVEEINNLYYGYLNRSLSEGLMGTEESIFSILVYRHSSMVDYFDIDQNGLLSTFFENVKNGFAVATKEGIDKGVSNHEIEPTGKRSAKKRKSLSNLKTSTYILTFNFPEQLEHILESFDKTPDWTEKSNVYVIDNSTQVDAKRTNKEICKTRGFTYLGQERNTGICGGRQIAADHFNESDADYMIFFEDDMTVNDINQSGKFCRMGFRMYIEDLFSKAHTIIEKEGLDFLKLSFTELFWDNNIQTSWYNVPQNIRSLVWPDYDKLPEAGADPNAPRTKFDRIENYEGLGYAVGEVYYCNWPVIVSKEGNRKMFIDTRFDHPFEQTWMSHIFQETLRKRIKAGVLLASPIKHDRIQYYEGHERREN